MGPSANTAFVPIPGFDIDSILCVQADRVVGSDNTVRYKGMTLQIPPSPYRHHYVKMHVRVHHYPDDSLAIFHGPREIGRYHPGGTPKGDVQTAKCRSGPAPATPSPALRRLDSYYETNRTYIVSQNPASSFALDSIILLIEIAPGQCRLDFPHHTRAWMGKENRFQTRTEMIMDSYLKHYINGKWVDSIGGKRHEVIRQGRVRHLQPDEPRGAAGADGPDSGRV
jgi:hypothetical protein